MTTASPESLQMAPHSQEAEEAVLGAVLINPGVFPEIAAFLTPADFFILRHGWVWEAMTRLSERDELIEYLTVVEELRAQERLRDVGGAAYITYLASNVASSLHAEAYARIVERSALRRRMLEAATDIAKLAREEAADINEVIDQAESALFTVTERRLKRDTIPIHLAVNDYFEKVEELYHNRDASIGVPTGFTDLDNLLGGLQKSDLLILAARPGVGKTSLMLNIALNAARSRARVAVFSLEMSNDQLIQRLISTETAINSHKLRLAELDSEEWRRFVEASGKLSELPIYLDDTPALSIMQLRTKCRRLYRETGLDLVVVDYLQLMTAGESSSRNDNRVQEVSAISRGLKELARELNVPVLAGAQLSRSVEQRTDKRPQLSDLRESGSLEQDADIVLFIYRDELYNEATERPNEADIIVAKHRNGPTGTVVLFFRKALTQFVNLARVNIDLEGL
ncbi:MAG: replicative DNA helicase [Anaerolineae bacterium]|nr:replicative DNA helicase [Anaerolineae bacterium]